MATNMMTFEIPVDVVQEFTESLEDDMSRWEPAVLEQMRKYEADLEKQGHSTSTMIAIYPADSQLFDLAVEGGEEPTELHITVLYLGKDLSEKQLQDAERAVQDVTSKYGALRGEIGGAGRFPASNSSDGKDVIVRLIDVPRLEAVRENLIAGLRAVGVEPVLNHGYTPHMTLAYVDSDARGVCQHPTALPLEVNSLWLVTGGKRKRFDFNEDGELVKGSKTFESNIAKVDADRQMVFGWVTVSEDGGEEVVDKQGDVISEDEMEKMAYSFVLDCRRAGEMHKRTDGVGRLVESMVFTKEKQQALGIDLGKSAWWCGFKVDDADVWDKVRKGVYKAFSIHGKGVREKVRD